MHRLIQYLRYTTVMILVIGSTVAMTAFYYLQGSAPQWQGRLIVPGLRDRVEILRTSRGVPDIRANQPEDIAFALGFSQAQDQFFAMDMLRRQPVGEQDELIGASRAAGQEPAGTNVTRSAINRQVTALDPMTRNQLSAYARGVNAALDQMAHAPLEYLLLQKQPRAWTVTDSMTILTALQAHQAATRDAMARVRASLSAWPEELLTFLLSTEPERTEPAEGIPAAPANPAVNGARTPERPVSGLQWHATDDGTLLGTGSPDYPFAWYPVRWMQQGERALAGLVALGTPSLIAGADGETTWYGERPGGEGWLQAPGELTQYPATGWDFWQAHWRNAGGTDHDWTAVQAYRHAILLALFEPLLRRLDDRTTHEAWPVLGRALDAPARAIVRNQPASWLPEGMENWDQLFSTALAAAADTEALPAAENAHPLSDRFPWLNWLFRRSEPAPESPARLPPLWVQVPPSTASATGTFRAAGPISRHPFRILEPSNDDGDLLIRQNGSLTIDHQLNLLPERERP